MCCDLSRCETWVDLIIQDMADFDVFHGIEWLAPYHVFLDRYTKILTLASSGVRNIA